MKKNELEKILYRILDIYNQDISNEQKYEEVSKLWTMYYKLSSEWQIQLDFAYQLYLMCENECYKIYQEPVMKNINKRMVIDAVRHLEVVLDDRKNGIANGISRGEAVILLDYAVNHVRNCFGMLGIDIQKNSLNGFCELGQILSIMPFENLGLQVTKNKAQDAFHYLFNHSFGTVWFPILENGNVIEEGYLVDTTYRQFFSSVRCNEGRYYALEENTGIVANPDPGYFVHDEDFAKNLMANGYILFTEKNAYLYGEGFYLSTLGIQDRKDSVASQIDYYHAVLSSGSDYSIGCNELDGLESDCFCFVSNAKGK